MITDEMNFELSSTVYGDKLLKIGANINLQNEKWITLDSINTKDSLQAVAVVPLNEYKVWKSGKLKEFSHIIFASRGSQEAKDFVVDAKLATPSKPEAGDQFYDYDQFVSKTINKYTTKDYSFTGHSLGGALAQYESVKHLKPATTFAAARSFNKLTDEEQAKAKNGDYWSLIKDYSHTDDWVGALPPNASVFYQQFSMDRNDNKHSILDIFNLSGHMPNTFTGRFNSNGSAKLAISPDDIQQLGNRIKNLSLHIDNMIRSLEDARDFEESKIRSLKNKTYNETYSGKYNRLTEYDVDDILHDLSKNKAGGIYRLHDDEELVDFVSRLRKIKQELYEFGDNVGYAGYKFKEQDADLGNILSRILS